jgi:methyltransferase (TIGR00027 family)
MGLSEASNLMHVARLRYIQSIHEPPARRNPDNQVRRFIPALNRLRSAWLGREELSKLRADPFYYYLVARTKYYDQLVNDAVALGVQQILNIGCGSDTRACRFKQLLCNRGVKVLECDQPNSIYAKQRIAKRSWRLDHVEYLPIDLNGESWPELEQWLEARRPIAKALVLMEGVSPYVNSSNFRKFLGLLARALSPGSHMAYDFKVRGANDDLGRVGVTQDPFRLSQSKGEVAIFHQALGLRLERMELSAKLCARLLPDIENSARALFSEDALVVLRVESNRN